MGKKTVTPPIPSTLLEFLAGQQEGSRYTVGIDPGIEGAITVIVAPPNGQTKMLVVDIPTTKVRRKASAEAMAKRRKQAKKKKQKKEVNSYTERSEYNFGEIAMFFKELISHCRKTRSGFRCCIEKLVVTLYRPGAKKCFKCKRVFGQSPYTGVAVGIGNGMWPMLFHALAMDLNFTYVISQTWKKYFNLTSKDKNVARLAASTIFKKHAHYFTRVKDHNRAESSLIACYALRNPEIFSNGHVSVSADG